MLSIKDIRQNEPGILFIGSHPGIIQSILDYDYLEGKAQPSVKAIIANGRKFERYFFGKHEVLLPVFQSHEALPKKISEQITYFYNVSSARRVLSSTKEILTLPHLLGGAIFAENVPEQHSLLLSRLAIKHNKFILGPASVGLLVPGSVKLGAIGGVDSRQLISANVFTQGSVAVFSSSGGMTNELINIVSHCGKRVSFALSFGGDRFPIFTPRDAFLTAEKDSSTDYILYFGELGGNDEYEIVELLKTKQLTKPIYCYIGGIVAELFETPPQFGHAKAMAKKGEETARAKREALRSAGVNVSDTFEQFAQSLLDKKKFFNESEKEYNTRMEDLNERESALLTTTISHDEKGDVKLLGQDLLSFAKDYSFAKGTISLLLGREIKSKELETFIDFVLRLLVDHGPYVSGAVNTIITARAGRDLVSSLSAGLLTIGPRFGGAINQAAGNWLSGVKNKKSADEFVEEFAKKKEYISGIGHKKYRVDLPDPRVQELLSFTKSLEKSQYTSFAKAVEAITVAKKGNLILNVDGAIAAILLDMLHEKEGYTEKELEELVSIEFFNALFVLSRSVGFTAHFLDQKRLDEGLFRLSEKQVLFADDGK